MTTQKMTEDEAIAYLRAFNAWRCGDESEEAPTPSTVTEAIRTACDALEGARRAVPANLSEFRTDLAKRIRDIPSRLESLGGQRFAYVKLSEVIDTIYAAAPAQPPAPAIAAYMAAGGDEEQNPVERLRFFLSCALKGRDRHDVEPFIDAVSKAQPATETAGDARDALNRVSMLLEDIGMESSDEYAMVSAILAKGDAT